jgi:rubrerythrin
MCRRIALMHSQIFFVEMANQKAPDARLERNAADGLFAKPSSLILSGYQLGLPFSGPFGLSRNKNPKEKIMKLEELTVEEAVHRSIQTEKNAMDFYRLAAREMQDAEARRVFEVLAGEEREHAASFHQVYTGSDIPSLPNFLETSPLHESDWISALDRIIGEGFNEQKALELAMKKEQQLEEALSRMAEKIADPAVKAVFEMNVRSTHNHYLMIESEYARVMKMVHESDMDTYVRE